jgi:O-antigen/teichoic acid export membrane protein
MTRSALMRMPPVVRVRFEQLQQSPVGRRLATGAFWSTVGEVGPRMLTMVASFVMARALGRVSFGELGIIQSTIGMFATLSGFGLGMTATKYVAQFKSTQPERAGKVIGVASIVSLITGGALMLVMILIGPWLASATLASAHLGPRLQMASLLLLLGAISGAQTGALTGFEAFRRLAAINVWTAVATFPLMIGGTLLWGLDGAIWGLIASRGVNCVLAQHALYAEARLARVPITHTHLSGEWNVLGTYSAPAVLSGLLVMVVYWVSNALLVNTPGGYAQMGLFNAANQWFNVLILLPTLLGQAAFPVLSEGFGSGAASRAGKVMKFAMGVNAAAIVPVAAIGSLASPLIMAAYGPQFRDAWPILIIVLATAVLFGVQTPIGHVIAASGRMWLGSAMNFAWGAVFIVLTWALLGRGAFGLALARLLAYVAHSTWTFAFALILVRQRHELKSESSQTGTNDR